MREEVGSEGGIQCEACGKKDRAVQCCDRCGASIHLDCYHGTEELTSHAVQV